MPTLRTGTSSISAGWAAESDLPTQEKHSSVLRIALKNAGGFTTVELMIVMVIIVLMSAAVVVSMSPALSDARLRSGSRMIVSALHYARSYAVAHQKPTRVIIDRAENGVVVEAMRSDEKGVEQLIPLTTSAGKHRTLPRGLEMSAVEKPGTDQEENFIGFLETGQAEQASVTITDVRGRQRRITVDGITGRCAMESDGDANPQSAIRNPK